MERWLIRGMVLLVALAVLTPAGRAAPTIPEVRVAAREFKFVPNKITLKAGQSVKFILVNKGTVDHDLHSEALPLVVPAAMGEMAGMEHDTLRPGKIAVVTFTPKKKGTFAFWCTAPGHQDAGMKGTIVIQ